MVALCEKRSAMCLDSDFSRPLQTISSPEQRRATDSIEDYF